MTSSTTLKNTLSFILVTGAMRSGTTLVGDLLGPRGGTWTTHPALAFSNDLTTTLRGISSYLREHHLADADLLDSDLRLDLNTLPMIQESLSRDLGLSVDGTFASTTDFLTAVLAQDVSQQAKVSVETGYIGMKATNMLWEIRLLEQCFNTAKMIVVLRDPRDTLASHIRRTEMRLSYLEAIAHIFPILAYFEFADTNDSENLLLVQYERLVADPTSEILRILNFVGLSSEDYNWDVINGDTLPSNSSYNALSGKGQLDRTGISKSSVGVFRKMLSPELIRLAEAVFSPYMAKYGYQLASSGKLDESTLGRLAEIFLRYYPTYRFSRKPLAARLRKEYPSETIERVLQNGGKGKLSNDRIDRQTGTLLHEISRLTERNKALLKRNRELGEKIQSMNARNLSLQKRNAALSAKNAGARRRDD